MVVAACFWNRVAPECEKTVSPPRGSGWPSVGWSLGQSVVEVTSIGADRVETEKRYTDDRSGGCPVKKGRHRRYEEARALKQNQDLDLDSIFESLDVSERDENEGSPAFDAWAEEYDEETEDAFEETAESA